MSDKDGRQIMKDFAVRRERQLLAIVAALFLVFFFALLHKRPTALIELSGETIFGAQVIVIAAFIGFTVFNWRCPLCNKFVGSDINRRFCRQCGSRLR
jgi:protein-S-isoprenylcysteine O-methyltransferase Ste14